MRRIVFILLGVWTIHQSHAQTCCSGGVPLSNNIGLPNEGQGSFLVGLNYDYNNLNTLNAGTDKLNDNSRLRITHSFLLNFGYSFTDRLSVESLFTWVDQSRNISQFGNENVTETSGVGDAVFLGKYSFPNLFGTNAILNLGLGAKAPFGKSNLTTVDGILLTADLQPGSGAWDVLGWMSISKGLNFRPTATFSGSLTYRITGKNKSYLNDTSVYEFGNEIQTNIGYTDQFLLFNTIFNPGLVLKYRGAFLDKINASNLPNTGGQWVFVRPEVVVQISPKFNMATRLEVPIYSFVEGTQLTPTLRFTVGISYKFINNKLNILK